MSRKDIDEEYLKNEVTISAEYSNDGIDVKYISASFKHNGSHFDCIAQEDWAQNLPIVSDYYGGTDAQLCITNTSLMATFEIYHSDYSVFAQLSVQSNRETGVPFEYDCSSVDAVGSWQIILPMPNLERAY